MPNEINNRGNNNIIIQGASDSHIQVSVNGVPASIEKKLDALLALLQQYGVNFFEHNKEIYQKEEVNLQVFDLITGQRALNNLIITEFFPLITEYHEVRSVLKGKPPGMIVSHRDFKQKALLHIEQSYLWLISRELRRMFSVNTKKNDGDRSFSKEERIGNYIIQGIEVSRRIIQLSNIVLISHLWNGASNSLNLQNCPKLRSFFEDEYNFSLEDHVDLLKELIDLYANRGLEFPIPELQQIPIELPFIQKTYRVLIELESLMEETYNIIKTTPSFDMLVDRALKVEEQVCGLLCQFKFLAAYKMVSVKRVEFEQFRNGQIKYLKDIIVLGEKQDQRQEEFVSFIQYSKVAAEPYAVLLERNGHPSINLFPLVIDYHSLEEQATPLICLYQEKQDEKSIAYYNLEAEDTKAIPYKGILDLAKDDFQIVRDTETITNLKKDQVFLQFKAVYNALVGSNE